MESSLFDFTGVYCTVLIDQLKYRLIQVSTEYTTTEYGYMDMIYYMKYTDTSNKIYWTLPTLV